MHFKFLLDGTHAHFDTPNRGAYLLALRFKAIKARMDVIEIAEHVGLGHHAVHWRSKLIKLRFDDFPVEPHQRLE